ncbi:MAG: ubiquitin-like small modifier protein 1 [Candidatus Thorarchaeota archaeon]
MHVTVRTIGPFTERFGFQQLTITFTGRTVYDLIMVLCEEYGSGFCETILDEKGNLRRYIKILINGRGLHVLQGLETLLSDGDEIAIFPPVAGGSFQK